MGVATMYRPVSFLIINILFIYIISCTPVNLSDQNYEINKTSEIEDVQYKVRDDNRDKIIKNIIETENIQKIEDTYLIKNITLLFSNSSKNDFNKQFVNVLELAIHKKGLQDVKFEIKYYDNNEDLKKIILSTKKKGKVYIGPIDTIGTNAIKEFCDNQILFFSFSSDTNLAKECIYTINFFPKNELEQLFLSLDGNSKVALLYAENKYGYMINYLIDDVVNSSDTIIVNRSSYKNDLSNVRDAIKELGKYNLRKYELERQKTILKTKTDNISKMRLKKLNKFKTTSDYDFTHVLIADYGLNLLQVAPLLTYYDIDPSIVQFLVTGVVDDDNFFYEPSLQGALFPGIEKTKRINLMKQYSDIYEEKLIRVSTLPYDLIGLLNYVFQNELTFMQLKNLLNNSDLRFDGVDGEFYFKNNMIERKLDILKISNGMAVKINE